jgi:2-polyprenyl-6-methoxyphenol hydroxylase-like FAD-dependent oxidoreductase
METVSATRPLLEYTLRTHVAGIDAVRIRESRHCAGYLLADAGTAVEGVRVREGSAERELRADLVVDATGRASATPAWLDRNGYEPPPVEAVRIGVVYSTTYVERPPDDRWTCLVPPSPPRRRGGMVAPVEGDRWVVTLSGVHGETPPTDPEGFRAYAASLPVPELGHLLDDQPPAARIEHYPFPENRRRRYESVARFPDGLLVVGDAVASFNPVYAQGMSVAALEALALHHALADGTADLAARFFDRAAAVVDVPWNLAAGADFGFPETTGPRPRGTAFLDWYLGRLVRRAHADGILTDAFLRVLTMERHPASLFRPGVLRRVLVPRLRGRGSEPRTGRRGGAEPPATGRRDEESGSPVVDRRASAED